MTKTNMRAVMAATASMVALLAGSNAFAAAVANSADPGSQTAGAGAEGTEVNSIIVTAERGGLGAKTAPVKASLDQTQPESIISHDFIEQITPEVGNISTVVFIAPSISGISGNAGGIGNYFSTTMRGFSDGQYNVTYDGIAFGDTNNPSHHPNDYFPTSTIGAAVVDRGPGAAGDLGQANYGGAIHYFSPNVSDTFGADQKLTYGTFNTAEAVTTLNTGPLPNLGGGKLLINLDERRSDTELSHSSGSAYDQVAKYVLPVGDKVIWTIFLSHAWSRYNFPDSDGAGETIQQVVAYGKNFQLTDIPNEEHYLGFNYERKQTWFNYIDYKYQATQNITIEDQPYEYYYSNKTNSTNNSNGLIGATNSAPKKTGSITDIGGYYKRNDYTVYGDVLRLTDELPFGVLKGGVLVEGSQTYRQKAYYDFTTGAPDLQFTHAKDPGLTTSSNCKTCEHSKWAQEQVFVDFNWKPLSNLTVSPGFKYVNFQREINATQDTLTNAAGASVVGPIHGTNTYDSPLYFLTANYKILPEWSIYAQYATSFLIPQLSELQVPGVNVQNLRPETTTNYQAGTVYTHGPVTADGDVYYINAANTNVPCNIPDPQGGIDAASCNAGSVHYYGVEGEAAYALRFGLTLFANGSLNEARQLAQGANTQGIAVHPAQELANVPEWTDAAGLLYHKGAWEASVTYKMVGSQVVYGANQIRLPSYDTANAGVSYDFGHFLVKVQGFNLLDKRSLYGYTPSGSETGLYQSGGGEYTYQSGREIDLTLEAKF